MKYTVNIQPVVPISLTQDWNLRRRRLGNAVRGDMLFPT